MDEFKEGVYDQLVTARVRDAIDRLADKGLSASSQAIEESLCPDYLARHLSRQIKAALRNLPSEDRKKRQIDLANSVLEMVASLDDPVEAG